MILVDPDDLAAHPTRDLAQLAFLIGRGLIDRTDPEIDNRSAHSSTLPVWQRKDAMRRTDNQSIFNTGNWLSKMARCLGFSARPFRGVFSYSLRAHSAPAANRHIHSLRLIRLIFTAPIDFNARRCERIRTLNPLRGEALRDLAIGIDAGEIGGPVWSVSDRGTAGAFRSSRTDRGAQVLPRAGATVRPWLLAKSARVSNLPACCALGPPACAAPCS